MNRYSQRTSGYQNIKLGTSSRYTLWSDGCFCCSLSMLSYSNPVETNRLLREQGGYTNQCLINSAKSAQILGLEYHGRTTVKPPFICIAEVKLSGHQHFIVFAPAGTVDQYNDLVLDPWDKPDKIGWKKNPYKVVSYRLFNEKKVSTEFSDAWKEMLDKGIYTEYTQHNTPVTTDMLAVFFSRYNKK